MPAKTVELEGQTFTVDFETRDALGGEPGVLYYGFAERPGELFKASRCFHNVDHLKQPETLVDVRPEYR